MVTKKASFFLWFSFFRGPKILGMCLGDGNDNGRHELSKKVLSKLGSLLSMHISNLDFLTDWLVYIGGNFGGGCWTYWAGCSHTFATARNQGLALDWQGIRSWSISEGIELQMGLQKFEITDLQILLHFQASLSRTNWWLDCGYSGRGAWRVVMHRHDSRRVPVWHGRYPNYRYPNANDECLTPCMLCGWWSGVDWDRECIADRSEGGVEKPFLTAIHPV